jgi:hypothetical protein
MSLYGRVYAPGDLPALAKIIGETMRDLRNVRRQREERAALANAAYSYDAQAPKLLEAVARALARAQ